MKINLTNVPNSPGVYLWKDEHGTILYVGKAKNLNSRMKQYFKGMQNSYKTIALVERIKDFDYIITKNNKEALVLERNLIEKNMPEYNIKLTDSKRYPYIMVQLKNDLEVRLAYRVRSYKGSTAQFFGPFPNGYGAKSIKDYLENIAKYEKGLPVKGKPREWYEQRYTQIINLLSGTGKKLINNLKDRMELAATKEQFEVARDIKEVIKGLSAISEKQNVEFTADKNIDVISFTEKEGNVYIAILFYRFGLLLSKQNFLIPQIGTVEETAQNFANQFYWTNLKPSEVISNYELELDINSIVPQKGSMKRLLDIARENAEDNMELKLEESKRKSAITSGAVKLLAETIGIKSANHIIMIDNSNTNNTNPVSAVVSYRNGSPSHKEYRKYKLELNDRLADVEYMRQGIEKYFRSNDIKPNLLIVDGGLAQWNEVNKLIKDIPIIGLVKNDKHVTDHMIDTNGKKKAIKNPELMQFLKSVQFEVDRYAKFQHNKVKNISTLEGQLTNIQGLGPKMEVKLLEHFKTYSAIYNANIEDLSKVIPESIAKRVLETFKNKW